MEARNRSFGFVVRLAWPLVIAASTLFSSSCARDVAGDPVGDPDEEAPGMPEAEDAPVGDVVVDEEPALVDAELAHFRDDCDACTDDLTDPVSGDEAVGIPDGVVAATTAPVAGSTMITKGYAAFRKQPSDTAAKVSTEPGSGVHDGLHPDGNPLGTLPPGKRVTLLDPVEHDGYLKVRFLEKDGWIAKGKLGWLKPGLTHVERALTPGLRNAFFKHQIRRGRFNKDGPTSSGNCGPTSLAMAASVFGKELASQSVEESIHRIRAKFDAGLHESNGTTRAQIQQAANAIGLETKALSTDTTLTDALQRIKNQLNAGRVVVLNGKPGQSGSMPTAYQRAFNRAYQRAIDNGASLAHSRYTFDGNHSILVLGRDADGHFVVGDPISEVGFIAITGDELKDFMRRYSGGQGIGTAVWR
jgi:hypothetical protein